MFAVQVSHKMIVSNLFQLERDVILLEPELDGVADDVQLLRQRVVGNGSRLHGLTYKVRPFPACRY